MSGDMPPGFVLHRGDCLTSMRAMIERGEKVDSVICDPPYHLTSIVERFGSKTAAPAQEGTDGAFARASRGFMGKTWDGGDIALRVETWRLCWELLPPGGHLAAFGGTRTFHRMAVAIEDAGFEIRDCLSWLYGSGFPKSHDVSKGIDKAAGAVRETVSNAADRRGDGTVYAVGHSGALTSNDPITAEAEQWRGWGTALKPAWEPIILARKPLQGTVAANVLAHGAGALNIDGCRVGYVSEADRAGAVTGQGTSDNIYGGGKGLRPVDLGTQAFVPAAGGRFPANVLHDGSDEVEAAFAAFGDRSSGGFNGDRSSDKLRGVYGEFSGAQGEKAYVANSGSASRFFYSAKADATDRIGSKHPTVKPVDLMRWLVRLLTPPGGTVLDPFAGSGTTGAAALEEHMHAILCEAEPEYQADIVRRMQEATRQGNLFRA